MPKSAMGNIYFTTLTILTVTDSVFSNNVWRGLRLPVPEHMEPQESYEMHYGHPKIYFESSWLSRGDRGLVMEPQPLCREIRTELPASVYVPNIENAEIYTFRPQNIYMVNCSRELTGSEISADSRGCWPQHCREKFVDIDIFGKPKTVKENLWQLLMEIPSVPIACECFKVP